MIPVAHEHEEARRLQERGDPPRALRVVALGGGTGLPAVLSGLARFAGGRGGLPPLQITAVVATSDDGGSSGRLRREQGILPPGDLRNCLVALAADDGGELSRIFQYRFKSGGALQGHAVGNLVLSALFGLSGDDFLDGLRRAETLLRCRGHVLPCTVRPVRLRGTFEDGTTVSGERAIRRAGARIRRVELVPQAQAAPGVCQALSQADVVVIGPGSLYSSVIAPLLAGGVAEALRESGALRVLVQNLMTQPGESDGLDAAAHLRAVIDHAGPVVDVLLVDRLGGLAHPAAARYAARGQVPVGYERRSVTALGVLPMEADLLARGKRVRHDPEKAAAAVLGLALEAARA